MTARTGLLLAALTGIFIAVGYVIGGSGGMVIAFIMAAGINAFSYWNSDKIVLRMHGAKEVDARAVPDLHRLVRGLAGNAGLPMPKLYIIENPQPNAFATGRSPEHAAVAVTTGILKTLSSDELAGVLAHELTHIKNRDTLTMTIAATFGGAISILANLAFFLRGGNERNNPLGAVGGILVALLAPLAAVLIQMAISRTREFSADRGGAEISGHPLWLAGALQKLDVAAQQVDNPSAQRNPATAHLFIVNPLRGSLKSLFSTHPTTEERVRRLQELAAPRA